VQTAEEKSPAVRSPGLFGLIGDLAGAGVELVHNTAELAACESRMIVRKLAVRIGLFIGFLVLAAAGLLLALGGFALLLGESGAIPTWLAFVLIGVATAAVAAILARRMIRKLGDRDLAFPGTLSELKVDIETFGRRGKP